MVKNRIYIIAGVSGVGKTTIGKGLAEILDAQFLDADDFHPNRNIQKMKQGESLVDKDRWPWLEILNKKLIQESINGNITVLACSALKESYRLILNKGLTSKINWVFLNGDYDLIYKRMQERDHFMPPELLQAQFADLELPPYGITVDVRSSPKEIINKIIEQMENKADIGLIGLGVMGKSLSRNIANNGYKINVYNRHADGTEVDVAKKFVTAHEELKNSEPFDELNTFVQSLSIPRKVFLMVNAGKAVDSVINDLLQHLDEGDIIIDGGNSHYKDTQRRFDELKSQGIQYIGSGVSGGEEGALKGPSIMPGGSHNGYNEVSEILTAIAAKDANGNACCTFIGKGGSGHFVKMVHNGIEYAEMQLIAEIYGILRFSMSKSQDEIATIFNGWSKTDSASYLLEISTEILRKKEGEKYLVDIILDRAGNKGTGSWTTIAACELGIAIPTITAALFARYQSSYYNNRQEAAEIYNHSNSQIHLDIDDELRVAYQQARIINHHQGMHLITTASQVYDWNINFKELARIWTNGCIIRSKYMQEMTKFIDNSTSILSNKNLNRILLDHPKVLNKVIAALSQTNISAPCFSSALAYFNGYKEKRSLANIIQAQRDYFGAHTYERLDAPRGEKFHTQWS